MFRRSVLCYRLLPTAKPQHYFHRAMSSIEENAAAAAVNDGGPTIFDKIISREIPSTVVFEDDQCLAFKDINPTAPVHILVIPKNRDGLTSLSQAEERHKSILGHLLYTAKVVAEKENLDKGYRIVINDGKEGLQSVYHLHIHLIGGKKLSWPPGC